MVIIQLNNRLKQIIEIVRMHQPITSEEISAKLNLSRAALRPDLAILTMSGILGARPKVGYFYIGMDEQVVVSRKLKEKKVEEMMSLPIMVSEDTSVYNTIVTMFLEDVGTIFICHKGYITGVVSRKDMLKAAIGGGDVNKIPVGVVMTRMPNIVFTYPEETLYQAAKKIIEHEVDSLPVVKKEIVDGKEEYKVYGRVTKTNITRFFVELAGM